MNALDLTPLCQPLRRPKDAHKGSCGTVLIVGGAPGMTGGLVLSGLGALYAGAGITKLFSLNPHAPALIATHPELMVSIAPLTLTDTVFDELHPSVIAIGPGLGQSDRARTLLLRALKSPQALVIDADALNLLALDPDLILTLKTRSEATILTPHPGEAARLLKRERDSVQEKREDALRDLIQLTGALVLLKGHETLIGTPDGRHHHSYSGNPGMASGGMGDVLTGIIAALLAQGLPAWEATLLGQELHGQAADRCVARGLGPVGLTASEVALEVRALLNDTLYPRVS